MRSALAVVALAALGVMGEQAFAQTVEASLATAFDRAERDFDATRAELALGGSAPLPGLQPLRSKPAAGAHRGKAASPARTAADKPQAPAKSR